MNQILPHQQLSNILDTPQLALHRLISALGLPDDEGEVMPSAGQLRSQVANRARWAGKDTEAARRRNMRAI